MVVVAMTPLLVSVTLSRGLNPVPFLLAFCFAANTGSAGTIIGSPQNMIAAQGLGLSFTGFLRVAALPALVSLPLVWGVVALLYRNRWQAAPAPRRRPRAAPPVAVDRWETAKAAAVTLAVVLAFVFSAWPRELIALSAAALLLLNRRISSTDLLAHVDGNLLLLLMGLFVVNAALAATGLPQRLLADLRGAGARPRAPLWLLLVACVLSNVVGNNPAVMLIVPYLGAGGDRDALGAALALGTGFSSNLVVFGSLAGIIVVEEAARRGVRSPSASSPAPAFRWRSPAWRWPPAGSCGSRGSRLFPAEIPLCFAAGRSACGTRMIAAGYGPRSGRWCCSGSSPAPAPGSTARPSSSCARRSRAAPGRAGDAAGRPRAAPRRHPRPARLRRRRRSRPSRRGRALGDRGIAVYAPDQRGFGGNASRKRWPGADALVADAIAHRPDMRARHPGLPLIVVGDSMGGGVALAAAAGGIGPMRSCWRARPSPAATR